MKLLALLLACLLWLFVFALMRIRMKLNFRWEGFTSRLLLDFTLLFSTIKIEIEIPEKMFASSYKGLLEIIVGDLEQSKETECQNEDKSQHPDQEKKKRYWLAKKSMREVKRHYVYSIVRFLGLKRKASALRAKLYAKVNLSEFGVKLVIGGSDAAQTGLLTGVAWSFLGLLTARLYKLVTVKKDRIQYAVIPCFDDEYFSGRLHCILNLKISHIMTIGYQFLGLIYKFRRKKSYGRTSN